MENYLEILEDSLRKKSTVLDKISEYNEEQNRIFSGEGADLNKFDEYIEKKDELIEQLSRLDDGFETLYEKVSGELKSNKDLYVENIKILQQLVKDVTDKSISIQAQETRNKALIEEYLKKRRSEIGESRRNAKSAYKYYQSLSSGNAIQSSIMDNKQ